MLTLFPSITIVSSPISLLRPDDLPHPERALAQGEVVRVRRGVYAPAAPWRALRPWARYLARVHAVALCYPDAIFTHESAAALLGMPVIGDPVTVHVLVSSTDAARESSGIRTHRTTSLPEIIAIGGVLVTSPAATAVSLARYRHRAFGLAAADAALRIDPAITREGLLDANESRSSSRGRRTARWSLTRATSARESVLESISDAAREWLGFPPPELQHTFIAADGSVDRGDQWWPEIGLLGEPDGEFKYDGRFGDPALLLRQRRARDRRLLRQEVKAVAHWGWIELAQVWPLQNILAGHGLPQLYPVQHAPLRSLLALLRPYDVLLSDGAQRRGHSTRAFERTTGGRGNG